MVQARRGARLILAKREAQIHDLDGRVLAARVGPQFLKWLVETGNFALWQASSYIDRRAQAVFLSDSSQSTPPILPCLPRRLRGGPVRVGAMRRGFLRKPSGAVGRLNRRRSQMMRWLAVKCLEKFWWTWTGSNRRPLPCHGRKGPLTHNDFSFFQSLSIGRAAPIVCKKCATTGFCANCVT